MIMLIPESENSKRTVECDSVRALINLDKKLILTIDLYPYSSLEFFEKTSEMLPIFIFELLEAEIGPWAGDRIKIESVPMTTATDQVQSYLKGAGYSDFIYDDLYKYLNKHNLTLPKHLSPRYNEDRLSNFYSNWALYDHDADVYLDTKDYASGFYLNYDAIPKKSNPIVFVLANITGYEYWYVYPSVESKDALKGFFDETEGFSAFSGSRLTVIPVSEIPKTAQAMKL